MRFGEHFLDELKARLRPSEVIGRHVKLKRQGREFAGLSPFTNEKTPSFFVNDEKGFYHCFSSGKHGDVISFLMETQGLSFPEAVEQLANMAGLALPDIDPEAEKRAAANKKTIRWIEKAQDFFEACLRRDVGREAREYLKARGLSDADCKRFGIGFAPNSFDGLRNELTQMGAKLPELIEAGLLIKPDDASKKPWDRFRDRIMFPITDARGRLIAFGGRAMDKQAKAKYLNSPETALFHKGKILYRYPNARKALHDPQNPARGLIVAEGYMDVIALARAGFAHACAPLGTALTEDQLTLLWRAGPEPVLCFDGDKAGLRAAYRSIERALPLLKPGQTLRFAMLPDGQDPDDLIRDKGASAMAEILSQSIALVDLLWTRELGVENLDTPEARAGLKDRIFKLLRDITHDGVRDQYKTVLLEKFDQA
ncbi:MAG TPA: DNA primase, partial [Hellea balneolensis]|nr:DNA primase [Hellea balneolensis]